MAAAGIVAGLVALALAVWGVGLLVKAGSGGTDVPGSMLALFGVILIVGGVLFGAVARGLLIRKRRER